MYQNLPGNDLEDELAEQLGWELDEMEESIVSLSGYDIIAMIESLGYKIVKDSDVPELIRPQLRDPGRELQLQ